MIYEVFDAWISGGKYTEEEMIQNKVCQGDYVFIDREPDRMSRIVKQVLRRAIFLDEELCSWMDGFGIKEKDKQTVLYFHQRVNIENFFRSLYFELKKEKCRNEISAKIEEKTTL